MSTMNKIWYGLLLCVVVTFASDWPMFRGNKGRTGYYPDVVGFPKTQAFLWEKSFGCPIISSPSVKDRTLYIGARDSLVYAMDAISGRILWRVKTDGWVDSSPYIWKKMVLVGSSDNHIYVLDSRNGECLSLLKGGYQLSSPAVLHNGTILSGLGHPHKSLSAFGVLNPKWEKTKSAWSVPFLQMSYSSPSVYGDLITIGAGDGRLYGVSASQMDTLWHMQTGGGVDLSTPAIDQEVIYFAPGNYDKNVYAVNLKGQVIWMSVGKKSVKKRSSKTIHPRQFMQLLKLSPKSRAAVLKMLARDGYSIPKAISQKRAETASQTFYPFGGMKTSSVAVGQSNVFVIQKDLGYPQPQFSLIALDKATGSEVWRFSELRNSIKQGFCSSPVVTDKIVYFGWGEGKIYGLETSTGKKMWEDSLDGDIISSPTIADTRLYVATMKGNMYCYNLSETAPGESFKKSTYCYPNPARAGLSNIQVYVEKKATLSLVIYNTAEKPVYRTSKTIAAKEKFVYSWNLKNVANGVYFAIIRVEYSDGGEDKKILKIAVLN